MADHADVVPLRPREAPRFPEPADFCVEAVDPGHALSVTWSPDHDAVELRIGHAGDEPDPALVLAAEHVLDLVRALVEGLPQHSPPCSRPPAPVLPLRPRS